MKGTELYNLMPQRPPIVMVSSIDNVTAEGADSTLTIQPDNIFVQDGLFVESGIIEHIAQTAACFAGYPIYVNGGEPHLGYIGEIKKMTIATLPKAGETICTRLDVMGEAAGVTLIGATSRVGETLIAEGRMKIFIKE